MTMKIITQIFTKGIDLAENSTEADARDPESSV